MPEQKKKQGQAEPEPSTSTPQAAAAVGAPAPLPLSRAPAASADSSAALLLLAVVGGGAYAAWRMWKRFAPQFQDADEREQVRGGSSLAVQTQRVLRRSAAASNAPSSLLAAGPTTSVYKQARSRQARGEGPVQLRPRSRHRGFHQQRRKAVEVRPSSGAPWFGRRRTAGGGGIERGGTCRAASMMAALLCRHRLGSDQPVA